MGKIRYLKGRFEMANSVITDQTAFKDNLICVYNICHLNTTCSKCRIVPEQIINLDTTAPEGKYDLCFYYEPFYTSFLASNYAHAKRCKPRSDQSLRKGLINGYIFS